jgi:hypothetical protein
MAAGKRVNERGDQTIVVMFFCVPNGLYTGNLTIFPYACELNEKDK